MTNARPPADTSPQRNDEGAIERFTTEWTAAMKAKDVARLMSRVTSRAIPPETPSAREFPRDIKRFHRIIALSLMAHSVSFCQLTDI